ncbi:MULTISPECIES: two-component system response regulator NarL [Halomonadaceae]|uniref:LuxR family two component transcriptional regulator n=1 Tax=Onishia taeanensis TaxID=284577 RepID=A0A328XQR4_9GAMM|nr:MULTISPECIES: two-component system response regulator NarL [Halomonas]RAR62196.1 LuxR family two component transcriptional regulator [Halomonas taeanensis]
MMPPDGRRGVLIVDDHPLFRRGVRQLLEMSERLTCLGEADDGEAALLKAEALSPDLILLDLQMHAMDGIATLRALREAGLDTRVIILSVSDHQENVIAAIRAGADGYLLKDMPPDRLLEALERQGDGEMLFDPRLTALMAGALRRRPTVSGPTLDHLTRREREILRLLAKSYANKQIAQHLAIREGTVKVHMRHLLKKLEMHSRTEAAVWAAQQELG